MSKKFKLVTLGCRTNQYESAAYANQLKKMGYEEAGNQEEADLCIVNTCTVTKSADRQSRHEIRNLAKKNPNAKLLVTGCLAEQVPDEMLQITGVSQVIPNAQKEELLAMIFPEEDVPEFSIEHFPGHTRAFLKVQDGCNSFCTYCIIPYVRGRSRSKKIEKIQQEVKDLICNGYKEVVLTGINIGDFEGEKGEKLADLVHLIDAMPGLERLRISSIDPDEVDDRLIDAVLKGKKTCHSLHIVLQSGSNVILKRMNRKYTRQIFLDTVRRLQRTCSDFTFTTDIIVGFPGETEEDFEETLAVMREVKFAKVHMFPYSERKRTRAALFPNKVSQEVIKERKQRVLRLSEEMAFILREQYIGKRMKVLIEGNGAGHTENFLQVLVSSDYKANDLIEVECLQNSPEGLIGKCVL